MTRKALEKRVLDALSAQPVTDLHTHVFAPRFGASPLPGGLMLWGLDELLTYHYLVAEVYRVVPASVLPYERFWAMSKLEQAEHVWKHLFLERTPVSEACRGIVTTLSKLGLDPREKKLAKLRKWFVKQDPDKYVDRVMEIANVDQITMTNEVFSEQERAMWLANPSLGDDPRFRTVVRIDPLLRDWPAAAEKLASWGYDVKADFSGQTIGEAQRFLTEWIDHLDAAYVAASLPPEFRYPNAYAPQADRVVRNILMPVLAERGLPLALMIGATRGANPALRDAGDMVGKADVQAVVALCRDFPSHRFLITMLSRENQHELAVAARKFGNLMLFGCWWFLNNPSLIDEITRMRLELLGTGFVPQHSDARILDQLIYKWDHSRRIIAAALTDKYADLIQAGYEVTPKQIKRDAALLLRDNYREFVKR